MSSETIAKITVPQHYELDVLAHRAGANHDIIFKQMYYENGQLCVPGVTQAALDESLANYDYAARMAVKYQHQYQDLRRAEYPPIGDQLDALWKTLQPEEGTPAYEMQQIVMAVKDKYPKPSEEA